MSPICEAVREDRFGHWAAAVDVEGNLVLSEKVVDDEHETLDPLTAVREVAERWSGQWTRPARRLRCCSLPWSRTAGTSSMCSDVQITAPPALAPGLAVLTGRSKDLIADRTESTTDCATCCW